MNNKVVKIIAIISAILFILLFGMNMVYADSDPFSGIEPKTDFVGDYNVKTAASNVLGMIQLVGTAVAIGMLLYLGIKYMISSPDDRASVKHSATIYVIGAIVLFAAVNIVKIIYDFANSAITHN